MIYLLMSRLDEGQDRSERTVNCQNENSIVEIEDVQSIGIVLGEQEKGDSKMTLTLKQDWNIWNSVGKGLLLSIVISNDGQICAVSERRSFARS